MRGRENISWENSQDGAYASAMGAATRKYKLREWTRWRLCECDGDSGRGLFDIGVLQLEALAEPGSDW